MSQTAHTALAALLLLVQVWEGAQGCSNVSSLSEQLDGLLALYDREQAPARPVRVHVALDLHHATVQRDATVHMLADLTLSWEDPRITWNASEWGCDSVVASFDRLWLPEVRLLNGAGPETLTPLGARLHSEGRLTWPLRYDAAVPLTLDYDHWPQDTQTVVFKFGSRTHTLDELILDISNVSLTVVFEAGAWEMEKISSSVSVRGGARAVASWAVRLRRRAGAQAAAAGAVLAAAALTLLAAALLPPHQRAPLCASASFTSAIWLVSAAGQVPGAASAPRSMRALGGLCAAAAAAALAAAAAARLAARKQLPPRPLAALASALSRWCSLTPHQEWCSDGERGAWVALAQLLDYVLGAALLVAVLACVCAYF